MHSGKPRAWISATTLSDAIAVVVIGVIVGLLVAVYFLPEYLELVF